jgi:hypothetical protein
MTNVDDEVKNRIEELAKAMINAMREQSSRQSLDVVPEFISLLTSKMETSVAQRRLVLTSLYRDFHGETNAGKASEIVKSIQRLFPETCKQVWHETEMGISVGQVLRWLREEIPERVKHSERQNPETRSMEHFYFYS